MKDDTKTSPGCINRERAKNATISLEDGESKKVLLQVAKPCVHGSHLQETQCTALQDTQLSSDEPTPYLRTQSSHELTSVASDSNGPPAGGYIHWQFEAWGLTMASTVCWPLKYPHFVSALNSALQCQD